MDVVIDDHLLLRVLLQDELDDNVRLNLLSLEALAAAEHQNAELCLATADQDPPLLAAAAARGTATRLVVH